MDQDQTRYVAAILNAGYLVRYYARGGRLSIHRQERARAILAMGVAVLDALSHSNDYEAILAAVVDGLRPRNDPPF